MVAAWTALTAARAIDSSRVFISVVWQTRVREVLCNCDAVDFCSCRDLLRLIQEQKKKQFLRPKLAIRPAQPRFHPGVVIELARNSRSDVCLAISVPLYASR